MGAHWAFVKRGDGCSLEEIADTPAPRYGDACRPLYQARVRAQHALREVAGDLRVAPALLSSMEHGRVRPSLAALEHYARYFGVDAEAVRAACDAIED